jgi:calcium permeable stress-gated cation channel
MSDQASIAKTQYTGYDRNKYLAHGPQASEIELSRLDTGDQAPLLPHMLPYGQSQSSLPAYPPSRIGTPVGRIAPDEIPTPPLPYQSPYQSPASAYPSDSYAYPPGVYQPPYESREAPMHRPQPSRQGSSYSYAQPNTSPNVGGEANMAGRGARGAYRA